MNVLDIFYNNIVPEAQNGRINCLTYYNIVFSTNIVDKNELYEANVSNELCLVPTLYIKNKELFDKLLTEYVDLALDFYSDYNYDNEILDYKAYDSDNGICKEKVIIALLFANATVDDFNDPILFLKNRINFMKNNMECNLDIGYCDSFKGNINIQIDRDIINNETPYQFTVRTINDDGEEFVFPRIKFGISNDSVYIYAIQNKKNIDSRYAKKINRELYKIGTGFNEESEDEHENLKDITASFLVSLNMMISYFYNNGYKKIIAPSILIERWNAKTIANNLRATYKKYDEEMIREINSKQELLQSNLTNKLMRTFLRLIYHYNNIYVSSYPYEIDSSLHININDEMIECNNPLLDETYRVVENYFSKNKTRK